MYQESAAWISLLLLLIAQPPKEFPKGAEGTTTLTTISEIYMASSSKSAGRSCNLPATFLMGADRLSAGALSVVPEELSLSEGESYDLGDIHMFLSDSAGEIPHVLP